MCVRTALSSFTVPVNCNLVQPMGQSINWRAAFPGQELHYCTTSGKLLNISDNLSSKLNITIFTILTSQEFCEDQLRFTSLLAQITGPVEM